MESGRSTPSQINELDARTMPRVWPISGGALFRHQIVVTLAIWRPLPSWLGGRRLVDALVAEQRPDDAGRLIRDSPDGTFQLLTMLAQWPSDRDSGPELS